MKTNRTSVRRWPEVAPVLGWRHTGRRPALLVCAFLFAALARGAEDVFDRVEEALSVSAFHDQFRARVSGLLDLEQYHFQLPAPGVIRATGNDLFNPRLALFLDAQLGAQVYVFAQSRADRGYDPGYAETEVRLDEYALRFTPWKDGRLNFQLGKFSTVVGNWTARHGSWANPFITAPLPYEHLTGVWDFDAVRSSAQLLQWSHVRPGLPAFITAIEKDRRLPIVWGPSYASGVAVSGELGHFGYAAEMKHASLSSRPEAWEPAEVSWEHATVSARLHYRPNAMWNFGLSASSGAYLRPFVQRSLAPGHGRGDYRERVLGQDIAFAWHHWQVWTEIYAARFEVPTVGNAGTVAYYAEAKYKFTPQLSAAVRWNQQLFGDITDRGVQTRWGQNLWRMDFAPAWRFTPHLQLKLQYSLQHGDTGTREFTQTLAAQFTVRF